MTVANIIFSLQAGPVGWVFLKRTTSWSAGMTPQVIWAAAFACSWFLFGWYQPQISWLSFLFTLSIFCRLLVLVGAFWSALLHHPRMAPWAAWDRVYDPASSLSAWNNNSVINSMYLDLTMLWFMLLWFWFLLVLLWLLLLFPCCKWFE